MKTQTNERTIKIQFSSSAVNIDGFTVYVTADVSGTFEYGAHFRPTDPQESQDTWGWGLVGDVKWENIRLDDMVESPRWVNELDQNNVRRAHELTLKSIKQLKSEAIDDLYNEFQQQQMELE